MFLSDFTHEEDFFLDFEFEDGLDIVGSTSSGDTDPLTVSPSSNSLSATDDSQEDVVIPASVANKRKRRRNAHLKDKDGNWLVPRIHLPRIPKSDIRRSFGIMFTNVYNSCNYEYMTSFVDKFISNDCHYSNIRQDMRQDLEGSKDILGNYWFERMQEAPDVRFHYEATRIKVRSDGTAVLQGHFKICGTKVISHEAIMRPAVEAARVDDCDSEHLKECYLRTQGKSFCEEFGEGCPQGPTPTIEDGDTEHLVVTTVSDDTPQLFRFEVMGNLTLNINAECQIEGIATHVLKVDQSFCPMITA